MKLCVRKIYCDSCRKLVRCREEQANGNIRELCSKCGKLLRFREGLAWRYVREG